MDQRRVASLVGLLVLAAGVVGFQTIYLVYEREISPAGELLLTVSMPLFLTLWIQSDARCRRSWPCFDFGTFVIAAWSVAMPWYLISTRRGFGILLSLAFFAIMLLPYILAVFVWAFIYNFQQLNSP